MFHLIFDRMIESFLRQHLSQPEDKTAVRCIQRTGLLHVSDSAKEDSALARLSWRMLRSRLELLG